MYFGWHSSSFFFLFGRIVTTRHTYTYTLDGRAHKTPPAIGENQQTYAHNIGVERNLVCVGIVFAVVDVAAVSWPQVFAKLYHMIRSVNAIPPAFFFSESSIFQCCS